MKFLSSLILLMNTIAFAQGTSGNTGNDLAPEGTYDAWFVGSKAIRYCLEISPQFGADRFFVETQIQEAFQTWRQYLVKNSLDARTYSFDGYHGGYTLTLPTKTVLMLQCDGTEDLHFYFGIENEKVKKEKEKYVNPDGFAKRESFDLEQSWGKGFIWIANEKTVPRKNSPPQSYPVWTQRNQLLRALLTHELGHVYGTGHVEGTIMAEHLASKFEYADSQQFEVFDVRVDQKIALVNCDDCVESYRSSLKEIEISPETFKTFVGKVPVGRPRFSLEFKTAVDGPVFNLSDDSGKYPFFEVVDSDDIQYQKLSEQVFGVTFFKGKHREHETCVAGLVTFDVKLFDGTLKKITIAVNSKSDEHEETVPHQIYYKEAGKQIFLLRGQLE